MQKLHPKVFWLFFFKFLFVGIFPAFFLGVWIIAPIAVVLMAITGGSPLIAVLIFSALYILFCWFWAKLTYRYYGYELTEDAFKKERGVIWKKYISIPYERIQNVDIYRGVFTRILGLSDLQIQTAGYSASYGRRGVVGAEAEGRLPGLDKSTAEQLREELIERAKGKKQGL